MRLIYLFFIFFVCFDTYSQLNKQLHEQYSRYAEPSINTRRFKYEDIMKVIEGLGSEFKLKQVGTSVEGRAIKLISYGTGPINVLMWSQMHGDETTATRSILDIFRWLAADDEYNGIRNKLRSTITWHFIPMLNPDGASKFTRRNHFGIDINRDALHLQTQEGRTLKRVRDSLEADWGFNLHDQGRGTSVEGKKPATISLLAPAYNQAKSVNEKRGDAMQLARHMFNQITEFIPGQIGIYDDTFEPRAFGDNIQKWGTRTILIESGGYKDDWEKEYIRQLNFILLITAAESIANKSFEKVPIADYTKIPRNGQSRIRELIVRNINFEGLKRDIAFDRGETDSPDFRKYYSRSSIVDIGDLSTSHAHFELDAAGYTVSLGKVYEKKLENISELLSLDTNKLWNEGYTDFVVKEDFDPFAHHYNFNLHTQSITPVTEVRMGGNPSLLLLKGGKPEYAIVNGLLYKL